MSKLEQRYWLLRKDRLESHLKSSEPFDDPVEVGGGGESRVILRNQLEGQVGDGTRERRPCTQEVGGLMMGVDERAEFEDRNAQNSAVQ